MEISTAISHFLYFLRASLDIEEVSDVSISKEEWGRLYQICNEQSLTGLFFPLIEQLPKQKRPATKILLNWYMASETIRKRNQVLNQVLARLMTELEMNQISALVVKGQICAAEYGDAKLLRSSGDIDVLINLDDWKKLLEWLHIHQLDYSSHAAEKHIEIGYFGVTVEFHHHLMALSSTNASKYWDEIEGGFWTHTRNVVIDEYPVRTLDITDTAAYLLLHIHHHLLTEGIGLRQICDFALFLKNHSKKIDIKSLNEILMHVGFKRAFTAFSALCTDYLGLKEDELPIRIDQTDHKFAKKLLQTIIKGGNFGKKNNLKGVNPGLLHSMNTALLVFSHSIKYYRLAPAEARMYWYRKIFWRMHRIE